MTQALEIGSGIVLGIATVLVVFWFALRSPPSNHVRDQDVPPNPNADYWAKNMRDDGQGGF